MDMLDIRSSSLGEQLDCARRRTAKHHGDLIKAFGFEPREDYKRSVGAALGTAFHDAAGWMLEEKMHAGELPAMADAVDRAWEKFKEEASQALEWDDTTNNFDAAAEQLSKLIGVFIPYAYEADPIAVELALEAPLAAAPGMVPAKLSGHVDVIQRVLLLDDHKTGSKEPQPQAQLGGYALLATTAGINIRQLSSTWYQRVGKGKPQPDPVRRFYPVYDCARLAEVATDQIRTQVHQFVESGGDPTVFPANPSSYMCSRRYCPVWGTPFCTFGK